MHTCLEKSLTRIKEELMNQGRGLGQQELLKETMKYLKMAIESMATQRGSSD